MSGHQPLSASFRHRRCRFRHPPCCAFSAAAQPNPPRGRRAMLRLFACGQALLFGTIARRSGSSAGLVHLTGARPGGSPQRWPIALPPRCSAPFGNSSREKPDQRRDLAQSTQMRRRFGHHDDPGIMPRPQLEGPGGLDHQAVEGASDRRRGQRRRRRRVRRGPAPWKEPRIRPRRRRGRRRRPRGPVGRRPGPGAACRSRGGRRSC